MPVFIGIIFEIMAVVIIVMLLWPILAKGWEMYYNKVNNVGKDGSE